MASHDYSGMIAKLRGAPGSGWTATFSVDHRVLGAFSDDLDGRIVAEARRGGARLWSEDQGTRRVYHLEGAGSALLPVLELAQRDLNQHDSEPIKVWGSASFVAEVQYELARRCAADGVTFDPTVYPAGWRKAILVATLSGPLADVRLLMWDVARAVSGVTGQAMPRIPRPAHPPVAKPPEPGLAVA